MSNFSYSMLPNLNLILHNIRSAHNVGSIFRTADAAGVSKIYLIGYTPAPRDKFERANKEIAKTALGAEQSVKWKKVENVQDQISKLKQEGYKILALEQAENSVDYREAKLAGKTALILGNEVSGIESEILAECDQIIEISMRGEKESLNVSVAAGIALFRLVNR